MNMNKLILLILLLSTLVLSACSLPEDGLCFQGSNINYNYTEGGSGLIKVFNCNNESISEEISIIDNYPIIEVSK